MRRASGFLAAALYAVIFISAPASAAEKKPPPKKKPAAERYDPQHLPMYEVACGRHRGATPCNCMQYRVLARQALEAQCDAEKDKAKALACWAAIPACPDVIDADRAQQPPYNSTMPAQCSRSCLVARCTCCQT